MKKIFILVFGLFSCCDKAICQSFTNPVSNRYISLSTQSCKHYDVFSISGNQASLQQFKKSSAGIYCEKKYFLNELNNIMIATALKTKAGNIGFIFNYNGFSDFNEYKIGILYSKKINEKIDIGIQFNYFLQNIKNYGSENALSADISLMFHLTPEVNSGIQVINPVSSILKNQERKKLPYIIKYGLGYDVSNECFIGIDFIKEENKKIDFISGIQYQVKEKVFLKFGLNIASMNSSFAVGFGLNKIKVDLSVSFHPQLGVTPGLSLCSFNYINHTIN